MPDYLEVRGNPLIQVAAAAERGSRRASILAKVTQR
jgi:hypothetical protein